MSAALPLAVIGCGLIGLRHVQVARALDSVELTAVVEPNPHLAERLRAQGIAAVATLDEVPRRTQAAIVATPTPDHAASGAAALKRGWAVLVEKPLAATLAEADALIDVARSSGGALFTGHHRRCQPFVKAAHQLLSKIGDPVAVQGMWALRKHDAYFDPDWRRAPGAGPLMTNLSHEIDLLRLFMGDIEEVATLSSNAFRGFDIEDSAALSLRFASGALGSFLISDAGASPWSFEAACGENPSIAESGEDYLRFSGTGGAMAFPSMTLWGGRPGHGVDWGQTLHRHPGLVFDRIDPIREQMAQFAKRVRGGENGDLADAEDGRAALEMTLAAVLSAARGQPVKRGQVPGDYDGVNGALQRSGRARVSACADGLTG